LEQPLAAVITSIGMDHMQQLGTTIEEIASEKAGIFKAGVPAIVNVDESLRKLFRARSDEAGAVAVDASSYQLPEWTRSIEPQLPGEHQKQNLRTALVTLDVIGDLEQDVVTQAVANVASLTGLRGRLEVETIGWRGKTIERLLDVGHNEAAMARIAEFLRTRDKRVWSHLMSRHSTQSSH
jgi:folylpolyglutamate synthase/dihydropteroate synthase